MWMPTRCLAHQTCGGNCKNNYHEVMEIIFLVFHLFRQNHCYKAHCHKIIKKLYRICPIAVNGTKCNVDNVPGKDF